MQNQRADLEWRDGDVPVSTRFDDPYFSLENGLDETRHVFLAGNGLPDRFCDGFHVAELGFGTGLNLLASLQAWRDAAIPGVLHYTSFEAFPMSATEMIRAHGAFPELGGLAEELAPLWGRTRITLDDLQFEMITGDARLTLPDWDGMVDAWYLDGFSPAKNPELWEEALLSEVAKHTVSNGTASTYTAAGFVRRGLQAAGFEVARQPGYGRKRHMSVARKVAP